MSDIEKVNELREATGAGFKDCNLAVKEASLKTVQETDREKLDAKFSKKDKEKLN